MQEFLHDCAVSVVSNASASGTATVTSSVLDMAGYDAVAFIAKLNSVSDGCVLNLTVKENSANSTSSPVPVAVTSGSTGNITASTSSNLVLVADVVRPSDRYVFCTLARGTAAATVDSILAVRYRARDLPVTQPADVLGSASSTPEV